MITPSKQPAQNPTAHRSPFRYPEINRSSIAAPPLPQNPLDQSQPLPTINFHPHKHQQALSFV